MFSFLEKKKKIVNVIEWSYKNHFYFTSSNYESKHNYELQRLGHQSFEPQLITQVFIYLIIFIKKYCNKM